MRPSTLRDYTALLTDIKVRIRSAQVRATLGANAEMLAMYWDIGRMIEQRQKAEGWGAAVIPRLARDIRNELPEVKGFSERNIGYMIRFAREYASSPILQPPVVRCRSHHCDQPWVVRPFLILPCPLPAGSPGSVPPFPFKSLPLIPDPLIALPYPPHNGMPALSRSAIASPLARLVIFPASNVPSLS